MKRILRLFAILLGTLLALILISVAAVYAISGSRMSRTYDVPSAPVAVPDGDEAIAYGEHVATIRACNGCHGPDLGGATLIEDPMLGSIYTANLTGGDGGVLGDYSDAQLARAIRHGIGHDGKPLLVMPSQEFRVLSDEDLGALIAYLRAQPGVDRRLPQNSVGPMGRILYLSGQLPLLPAELIDHDAPPPPPPPRAVSAEYGGYLAVVCQGCHGPDFAGGRVPGSAPDAIPAANLTPGGELATWNEADFIATIRTGTTPSGHRLDEAMPWQQFASMSDEELQAVWLYLQSLPPQQ